MSSSSTLKEVSSKKSTDVSVSSSTQTTTDSASSSTQSQSLKFSATSGLISSINKTITQPIHTLAQVAGDVLDMLQGKTVLEGEEFVMHTEMTPEQAPVQHMEPEKVEEKKFSYEESITAIHQKVEKHKSEKTKREQEAMVHSALLSEAKALEMDATRQEAEFTLREQELEQQVKLNLKREMQFEAKRAAAHARAMEAENERAKAEAEKLMFAKEREYARQLEEKHAIGQLRAEVLTKQHEMQAKELQLAEERLRFERNNAEVLSADIQGPSSLEIEVGVKPRYLPEKHKIISVAPEATIASTLVSENYEIPPEEEIEDIFEGLTIKSSSTSTSSETTQTAAPSHDKPTTEKTKTETVAAEQQEKNVKTTEKEKEKKPKDKPKSKDKMEKSEQHDKSSVPETTSKKGVMRFKGKETKTGVDAESEEQQQQQHQTQRATS